MQQPAGPAEGWYPDPGGVWRFRHWDGSQWTDWVSNGSWVTSEKLPKIEPDVRAELPLRAIWWGIGGILVGEIIGLLLFLLADWLSDDRRVVELVVSQLGLWTGFVGAVVIASRRYGTGHVFRDFGVRMRKRDPGLGLGFAVLAKVVGGIALAVIITAFKSYFDHRPSAEGIVGDKQDLAALVTASVIAAIGAPFIEELLFRGLIMGSLRRLGGFWSVAIQGVLFASVHMQVSYGRSNILTFVAILVGGIVLGWCAHHYKRLGPGMWTHFFFNLVAIGILVGTST